MAAGAQVAWSQAGGRRGAAASFRLVKVASGLSSPVYVDLRAGRQAAVRGRAGGHDPHGAATARWRPSPTPICAASSQSGGEQGLLSVAFSPELREERQALRLLHEQGRQRGRLGAARAQGRGERPARPPPAARDPGHGVQPQRRPAGVRPRRDALHRRRRRRWRRRSARRARQRAEPRRPARQARCASTSTTRSNGLPYGIPKDNPFVGQSGWRPEIWALGLRNPWRFSFDRANGDLWIGDVGQNEWEEVDHLKHGVGGINFGWNRYEGRHDFADGHAAGRREAARCPSRSTATREGCSITGGYVYRGPKIAGLSGRYVYADYCSGKMWTLSTSGGVADATSRASSSDAGAKSITSFGEGGSGMLYVCSAEGTLYRFASR